MNIGIILSGGVGTRLGADMPKQYLTVGNQMVITYCMETFLNSKAVDGVFVVCDESFPSTIESELQKRNINTEKLIGYALPGRNRQESILHGLEAVSRYVSSKRDLEENVWVMIHDAARPLLTETHIHECFHAAIGHDGAMPFLPMKDTVYMVDDEGRVDTLLDRSRVIAGQSPEVFELKKYLAANKALLPEAILKVNGSTEPAIMASMDIATLPGDENNFKITTKADLERFREMVE